MPSGNQDESEKYYVAGPGKQELVPGSGIYISSAKLHSIHSQCDKSPKKLYLLLIEAFFSEETLATSLAHGSRTQTSKAAGVLSKALNQDVVKTLKGKGIRQQPIQKTHTNMIRNDASNFCNHIAIMR